MKANTRFYSGAHLCRGALFLVLVTDVFGQTLINLGSQSRNADFTNFPYTRPVKTGTVLPSSCSTGDLYLNTGSIAGQSLFVCQATNVWVPQGGLIDPGSNGILKRTASNATSVVAAPTGTIVGTSDSQVLTNKSIDASEVSSGVLSSSRLPVLTGDVTTVSGSSLTTLANVNNSAGTFGDANHTLQLTVDAKGRVVGLTSVAVASPSLFNQQMLLGGIAATQRNGINLSSAFAMTDNPGSGRTEVDLNHANANPGTFGSATQVPVLTVNAYGQVTNVSTVSAQAGSGGGSGVASAGTFTAIPASCTTGSIYLATDQPLGQQMYTCSSSNSWTQLISIGTSGALAVTNGSIDVVSAIVPRMNAANNFTGLNTFGNGVRLASSSTRPNCDSSVRGMLWFQNNGGSKDGLQLCAYTGSTYSWNSLY